MKHLINKLLEILSIVCEAIIIHLQCLLWFIWKVRPKLVFKTKTQYKTYWRLAKFKFNV